MITQYKRMGYVIIPKPNLSGHEGIHFRCRHFDLLLSPFWLNMSLPWPHLSSLRLSPFWRSTVTVVTAPFRWVAGSFNWTRWFLGVFFVYKKFARPKWDVNSWEEGLTVDTNSLRHLPRRSSKTCDLQFARTTTDRFQENYSIDGNWSYKCN